MHNRKSFPAVILGGGELMGLQKIFLDIDGRVLGKAPVEAAAGSTNVCQTILVSDPVLGRKYFGDKVNRIIPPGRDILESVLAGTAPLSRNEPALILCADQPFPNRDMVSYFIEDCREHPDADVWLGYVRKAKAEAIIPGFGHTYGSLADKGQVCMAGIAMIRPRVLDHPVVSKLIKHRKYVWLLLLQLGWRLLPRFLFKGLYKQDVEQALSQKLGCKVVGVEASEAFGFDVDSEKRLRVCRDYLSAQRES